MIHGRENMDPIYYPHPELQVHRGASPVVYLARGAKGIDGAHTLLWPVYLPLGDGLASHCIE